MDKVQSEINIRVRYSETDQMGVAHHSHYARWFEVGRIDLLEALGISYRAMEAGGQCLPLIDLGVKFVRPAFFDDLIVLTTVFLEVTPSRIIFGSRLCRENGVVLSKAYSSHALVETDGMAVTIEGTLFEKIAPNCYEGPFFKRKGRAFRY